ncbi:hypothetical protein ACFL6G_07830 [candidate division KSB1 bacterium]
MEKLSQLQVLLTGFSSFQKDTIAELASEDLLLIDIWKNQVNSCIRDEQWDADWLFNVMTDRISEIIGDLNGEMIRNQLNMF